jgi:NAD(P)-dependent dehydrogenase (short-subunit alcohol dehydrogenase family)
MSGQPGTPASGTVLVTGAAGGIGRAIVERLDAAGYDVVGADLAPAVDELAWTGERVRGVRADITSDEGRAAILDALGGPVFGLVNCAGITRDALLPKLPDDDLRLVLDINAVAGARLCEALENRLVEGGGIVNISSRAAYGNPGQVNYSASKGALIGLTRALARRLAPRVRVNAVAPGFIATEMTAAMPDDVRDKLVARVPAGRMGEPEEIAAAVVWLLGPESGYVTGQTLVVCGGRSI